MIEIGTLLQNRYLIEQKIGTGGMGAVYRAVDQRFDNHVAIKETFFKMDEFGEAFEREAKLLNALQHPVLPHVSDYFAEKDGYFLVMQYIEGEDLSDILKRQNAFSVEDVLRWTVQLLDALDYLHSQEPPVIHRDIKPHNLKLTPRGDVMLLDFGLAKLSRKDATEVSVFGYSRTYSPLEQVQGTGTDARSDIFALGATVYHLMTGKAPTNALTRAAAIVNENPDPLPPANEIRAEIPAPVASVINTALALNPKNRFISANAMRQALEHAVSENTELKGVKKTSAAAVGAMSPQIFDASNNTDFPALEAFAGAKNSLDDEKPEEFKIASPAPDISAAKAMPAANSSSGVPIIVDVPTKVSVRKTFNQNRLLWAVAAVLLLFGFVAALYFGGRGDSVEPTNQPLANANSGVNDANRESAAENSAKTATNEKTWEKSKNGETKTESAKIPVKRNKQTSENDPAVTEEAPLETDDAPEVVVTDSEKRPRRAERPIPDVMTEEEFQQLKREEKEKRRQRRNQPTPYQ